MNPPLSTDLLAVACTYEVVAILAGWPTITRCCGLHPALGVALVVLGAVHLILEVRRAR